MSYSAEERKFIISPYRMIADRCGISEVTLRRAMARKPITYQTAARIAHRLGIDPVCFRIKEDRRGRRHAAAAIAGSGDDTKKRPPKKRGAVVVR